MSTVFGVYKLKENIELEDDCLPENYDDDNFIEVAFRGNGGFSWRNELSKFLRDDVKVYPLDNSAQGIYTIGDIKREIND
jgi:hypothetical protein